MKIFFYFLWFVLIVIGAFTAKYIPETTRYIYGFIFGTISFMFLRLAKECN